MEVAAVLVAENAGVPNQSSDHNPIDRNEDRSVTNASNIGHRKQVSSTQHPFSNPTTVNHTTHEYKNYIQNISGGNIIITDTYSDDRGFEHDPVAKKREVTSYTNAEIQERYPLQHACRGNVLIVENNFEDMGDWKLLGYKKDSEHLKKFWEGVGCEVDIKENPDEMDVLIKKFAASEIHANSDYAVLVILSHGGEKDGNDIIYAVDRAENEENKQKRQVSLKTKKILEYFEATNATYLVGKPKLIILQCCRGVKDLGRAPAAAFGFDDEAQDKPLPPDGIPLKCDTMIIHAATSGNLSIVPEIGSVFITEMIGVFEEQARDTHVADMMIKVRRNMSKLSHQYTRKINEKEIHGETSQVSVLEDTTTRKFFLYQKSE